MKGGLDDNEILELDRLIGWLKLTPMQKFRIFALLKKWNGEAVQSAREELEKQFAETCNVCKDKSAMKNIMKIKVEKAREETDKQFELLKKDIIDMEKSGLSGMKENPLIYQQEVLELIDKAQRGELR